MEVVSGPPTVAEIDLGALCANYRAIKSAGRGAELMAVVKADAYGHGAIEVTRALRGEGCGHFGVARVCEARELRAAGVRERIYLLGGFLAERGGGDRRPRPDSIRVRRALIAPLERAAEAQARANFRIHLKVDSGATRLGILPDELDHAIEELAPRSFPDGRGRVHPAGRCRRSSEPHNRARNSKCSTPRSARLRAAGIRSAGSPTSPTPPRRSCGPTRITACCVPGLRSMDCRPCRPCASWSNCGP